MKINNLVVVLGILVTSIGVFAVKPLHVSADAANPSLMELIGKNPTPECANGGSVYPYGSGGHVDCITSSSVSTCPQNQSKYYKLLGDKALDYGKNSRAYYYCPTVQYDAAKCEQDEVVVECSPYYPKGSTGGLDDSPLGFSCGSYGKFPYSTPLSQIERETGEPVGFQQFKKNSRFLMVEYSKFEWTGKYCRKTAQGTATTTQTPTSTNEPATPVNNRNIILIGFAILGTTIVAITIILKVRRA